MAEIFDQPNTNEYIIRNNGIRYGSGAKLGILLFVDGNHYIVLRSVGAKASEFAYIDPRKKKYERVGETVIDGSCQIDGLYRIAQDGENATEEQIRLARRVIRQGGEWGLLLEAAAVSRIYFFALGLRCRVV